MAWSINAFGAIPNVIAKVSAQTHNGAQKDVAQFEAVRQSILTELQNAPGHFDGAIVEASGHADDAGRVYGPNTVKFGMLA